METANPVIELVKLPTPEPSVVLLSFIVGATVVLQQTPRVVTEDPPSLEIFPPQVRAFAVRLVAVAVVRVGNDAGVEKVNISP